MRYCALVAESFSSVTLPLQSFLNMSSAQSETVVCGVIESVLKVSLTSTRRKALSSASCGCGVSAGPGGDGDGDSDSDMGDGDGDDDDTAPESNGAIWRRPSIGGPRARAGAEATEVSTGIGADGSCSNPPRGEMGDEAAAAAPAGRESGVGTARVPRGRECCCCCCGRGGTELGTGGGVGGGGGPSTSGGGGGAACARGDARAPVLSEKPSGTRGDETADERGDERPDERGDETFDGGGDVDEPGSAASGGGMLASFRPPRPAPEPGSCADGVAIMTLGGAPAAPPIGGGRVRIGERTASSSGGSAPVSGGGAGAAPVLDNAAGIALAIDGGSARGRCDGVLEARAGSSATADTSCATCE